MGPNQELITIHDFTYIENYDVIVYQDCSNRSSCCTVTSDFRISDTTISLDNATVTCYAGLPSPNDVIISSDTTLSKHFLSFIIM